MFIRERLSKIKRHRKTSSTESALSAASSSASITEPIPPKGSTQTESSKRTDSVPPVPEAVVVIGPDPMVHTEKEQGDGSRSRDKVGGKELEVDVEERNLKVTKDQSLADRLPPQRSLHSSGVKSDPIDGLIGSATSSTILPTASIPTSPQSATQSRTKPESRTATIPALTKQQLSPSSPARRNLDSTPRESIEVGFITSRLNDFPFPPKSPQRASFSEGSDPIHGEGERLGIFVGVGGREKKSASQSQPSIPERGSSLSSPSQSKLLSHFPSSTPVPPLLPVSSHVQSDLGVDRPSGDSLNKFSSTKASPSIRKDQGQGQEVEEASSSHDLSLEKQREQLVNQIAREAEGRVEDVSEEGKQVFKRAGLELKGGTVDVQTRQLKPVVHEHIRRIEKNEYTTVIERDIHKHHVYPVIQPILDPSPIILPTKHRIYSTQTGAWHEVDEATARKVLGDNVMKDGPKEVREIRMPFDYEAAEEEEMRTVAEETDGGSGGMGDGGRSSSVIQTDFRYLRGPGNGEGATVKGEEGSTDNIIGTAY